MLSIEKFIPEFNLPDEVKSAMQRIVLGRDSFFLPRRGDLGFFCEALNLSPSICAPRSNSLAFKVGGYQMTVNQFIYLPVSQGGVTLALYRARGDFSNAMEGWLHSRRGLVVVVVAPESGRPCPTPLLCAHGFDAEKVEGYMILSRQTDIGERVGLVRCDSATSRAG
jgi:hypothetical protein